MMPLLLLAAAAAASADPCGAKPNQAAMTMCEAAAAERADAELNRTWAQVTAAMRRHDKEEAADGAPPGPSHAAALLASQRAWLRFRAAECVIESYEWRGGSMQPFTANQCAVAVTRARIAQLREMLGWGGR